MTNRMNIFLSLQLSAIFLLLPDEHTCMEIAGGREAKPHSRPYMVHISQGLELCAGILIKPDWVLTAAHCKINYGAKVLLGAHSISGAEKEKQYRGIKRVITHERFDMKTFDYDVTLLQLSQRAEITNAVKPLPLPKGYDEQVKGTICQVAGWGVTEYEKPSDKLKEANVTIIDRRACNKDWNGTITKNMICTREKGNTETCAGDSGGPLICHGILRGIISFGQLKCGVPGNSAVYTNLNFKILNWIRKNVRDFP